jgi:hypothetical protein
MRICPLTYDFFSFWSSLQERWCTWKQTVLHNHILYWRMASSGLLRRVALVRTDVSEEPGVSLIRVTKIGELGTTQAATSNRRTLRRNWWRRQVPPKCRFLQEPHGVTTQKTPFFIVTAVKTSNLTYSILFLSICWHSYTCSILCMEYYTIVEVFELLRLVAKYI